MELKSGKSVEKEKADIKIIEIYKLYYGAMMHAALSILKDHFLAEDAVSESMIKIFHNLEKIGDISCYKTRNFIVIIVENTSKNILKKKNNHKEDFGVDNEIENIYDRNVDILSQLTTNEGIEIIKEAIQSLSKSLADPLRLSLIYGYSDVEAAKKLGISHSAVRMRLSRAKKAIRKILGGSHNGK